jgi:hypothetical protein
LVTHAGAACKVTYKTIGTHMISARYGGDSNFTASASRPARVSVGPAAARGTVTSTMQWTFHFTPYYTTVLALSVNGISDRASVLVMCNGRGCPFAKRRSDLGRPKACRSKAGHRCPTVGSIALTPKFHNRRLSPGARITVEIVRPEWIGKIYRFTIRARQGPHIQIGCLAPGGTNPGQGC